MPMDEVTPTDLRVLRKSETARIIEVLAGHTDMINHVKLVQAQHGSILDTLRESSTATAAATLRMATLAESREEREQRREDREAAAIAAAQLAASQASSRWWAFLESTNFRLIVGGLFVMLSPRVFDLVMSVYK